MNEPTKLDMRATLEGLEESLWRKEIRNDRAVMEQLLADDVTEFGRSGRIWRRVDLLGPVESLDAALPLADFAVRMLDDTTALVTYISQVRRHGGSFEYARRSSIWSNRSTGWVLRFHQGTPFVPDTIAN